MPRTLAQLTRSLFRHGGGGWDDWSHFSRMKISSFAFVQFSLRLFLDAQASTWDTSHHVMIFTKQSKRSLDEGADRSLYALTSTTDRKCAAQGGLTVIITVL